MSIRFAVIRGINHEGECLIEKNKTARRTFLLWSLSRKIRVFTGLSPLNW
jgi:hypothetical protein